MIYNKLLRINSPRCYWHEHFILHINYMQSGPLLVNRNVIWTWQGIKGKHKPKYNSFNNLCLCVEIKRPTRCNRWLFIAKLIVHSTCFGHHYAHHQEIKSIIQVVAACGTWCFDLQVVSLVWSCRLCTTGSNHLYNTLELLMMGIMVPETCWAIKNHLLHLVGLFISMY